ncbi:MAG: hypothetical protein LBT23_11120, partial [Synergistaceae bacterium]|nr:hypothetical protein [Synergistaceae bacterium]
SRRGNLAFKPSLRGGDFSDVAILLLGLDSDLRVYASLKVYQDKRRWYKIAAAMKKKRPRNDSLRT